MARLVEFPQPLHLTGVTVLSGPNARNSGANTASDGSEQTFDGVGNVWSFKLDFTISQNTRARRLRGALTALLSGANAMRWQVIDGDRLSLVEAGLSASFTAENWSNDESWSNGQGWGISYPTISVAEAAAVDAGIVKLADSFWGHNLGMGDRFGFYPFHFGLYEVVEVIADGEYRIWPRLRKAITTDDYATLHPIIALKPTGQGAVTGRKRGISFTENQSVTLVEVIDPYARSGFAD